MAIPALLVVVLGGAGAAFLATRSTNTTARPSPGKVDSVEPAVAAIASQADKGGKGMIQLSISATPADAKLFLDDGALPENPYRAKVKGDGTSHKLRVEAPGFATENHFVVFDKDVTLDLRMSAEKPDPAKAKAAAGAATPGKPGKPGKPQLDTDNPY